MYRRHNFYLWNEISQLISLTISDLLLKGIFVLPIAATQFMEQSSQNQFITSPNLFYDHAQDKVYLVPDCVGIRNLLGLSVYNMDDWSGLIQQAI